jgi:hypothetical protein
LHPVAEDTLALAADAESVSLVHRPELAECALPGHAVVESREELARLREYPQCRGVVFPDPARATLVGLSVWVDCAGHYRIQAFRSRSRRELRVALSRADGGCRAMLPRYAWVELPALPAGWSLRISEARVGADRVKAGHGWQPARPG